MDAIPDAIPNAEGGVKVHRSLSNAWSAGEYPMLTSDLNTANRQKGGRTPKPPETARFYHGMMSSLQNKDAIIEQPREAFGLEATLQEEVAARHRAESSLGVRCDRLEMSLLALYSHCVPEGGDATTLSERLNNLEITVKGSLNELNTQLETLRHTHAGLARAHDGLEAGFESSYAVLQGQQESLRHCLSGFSREFEVVKQAQSSHASRLWELDNATKELSGAATVANVNIATCRRQTSALESTLEDHIVALMERNASLEKSVDTLGYNNRSSANSSPRALAAIEERLAAIEREQALLASGVEAFGAVETRLTAIEKEHGALPHGPLTLDPFDTDPVQSPIASPASTTMQIAEACAFSVGSEDSSEGIESIQAVSVAQTTHYSNGIGCIDVAAVHKFDNNNVEEAAPTQKGHLADDLDPRIIAQQNFAVALNILKIARQKRQDEQQPTFLNISARVVKGVVSCFPVTS